MQKQSIIERMLGIKLDCIYNLKKIPKIKLQGNSKGIYKIRLLLFFFQQMEIQCISQFQRQKHLQKIYRTSIALELLKTIEKLRFAIIILSRNQASSKWCLIELTKIVECIEKIGLVVLPVFDYVDPSDVRNHRGTFGEAFAKHEESFKDNIENVQTWKAALTKVANLAGWDLTDKYEFLQNNAIYCQIFFFFRIYLLLLLLTILYLAT